MWLNLEGQATSIRKLTDEGKYLEMAWNASQVCLEYKPSLLGAQVKFAWSASQVTLRDKFAWSASQVALRDKPPSLSDLGVKATAFIDLEYTPSHLRPQASSIE